jgi:hypothetical protein
VFFTYKQDLAVRSSIMAELQSEGVKVNSQVINVRAGQKWKTLPREEKEVWAERHAGAGEG